MSNTIKSYFISAYTTALFLAVLHVVYRLSHSDHPVFWLGMLIALAPSLGFFLKLFLRPTARTSPHLAPLLVSASLGTLLSAIHLDTASFAWFVLYNLGLGVGGLLLYVFWYSKLGRQESQTIIVGERLPTFELKSSDGTLWQSSDLNQYPAVMLFFRGNWCPLCMAQIKEVARAYGELEKMGVRVCLISPQPESNTRALAQKFEVSFQFLTDTDNAAAKLLGINADQGTPKGLEVLGYESDTVLPTVIALDASGKVLWSDQTDNYRVRPEPETFINVFRQHGIQ